MAVLVVAGGVVYAMLMSSTTLLAKNLSLNSSNTLTRVALDRMYAELNQANRLPTLVDDTGTPVTDTSQPTAGIAFDGYCGWSLHRRESWHRTSRNGNVFQTILFHRSAGRSAATGS